jgi:hypothetical protein
VGVVSRPRVGVVCSQRPSSDDSTIPLKDSIGSNAHIAIGRVKVQLLRRRLLRLRLWLIRRASIARLFNAPRSRVLLTFGRCVLSAFVEMFDQLGRVPAAFFLAVLAYCAFGPVARSWWQSRKVLFHLWQWCSSSFALLAVRLGCDADYT